MRESLRRLTSSSPSEEGIPQRVLGHRRVRIELLDGEHINLDINRRAKGSDLLDKVCEYLDILEKDYFGLLHTQRGDPRVWIDLGRKLSKTFQNEPWDTKLAVKFYPPEPSHLFDDVTRYQLTLAVRRDLVEGRLNCSDITHALLSSYALQAELGDFEDFHTTALAISNRRLVPLNVLTPDLEEKIVDLHRKHNWKDNLASEITTQDLHVLGRQRTGILFWNIGCPWAPEFTGQTPAEAELNYLENAKKLPLYGAELHCARDSEDIDLLLAICWSGIRIYRDGVIMNCFPWAKITKICYNKRVYTLKLRASEFDECETHLSFKLISSTASKKLWRCSVEHHMFFRREAPVKVNRILGFPHFGSRRLSCRRTLRQLRAESPMSRELTAS